MTNYIHPYKAGSESVSKLAEALGASRIKLRNSRFQGSEDKKVINWGCSTLPDEVLKCDVLNKPVNVKLASNKLAFFSLCYQHNENSHDYQEMVRIPEFTTDKSLARRWLSRGICVVERHKLTGHSGEGIKVKVMGDEIEDCPLYVKYVKKVSEWRIHVLKGKVVDIQRKARDTNVPDENVDWKVRNHANGFIYARNEGVEPPREVLQQAVLAVKICGLDFGAVDIIYNQRYEHAFVLEINTAPGLSGSTLTGYAERFKKVLEGNYEQELRVGRIDHE